MLPGTSTDVEDTGNIGQHPRSRKRILPRGSTESRNRLGHSGLRKRVWAMGTAAVAAQANQRRARAHRATTSMAAAPARNPAATAHAPALAEPPLGSSPGTRFSTPPYHMHM